MIKAIFTELNQELGHQMTIGEKVFETDNINEINEKAKEYANVLSDVRGKSVSFMLQKNGAIIAELN